jgi:serine kinase of HPr protein (carbohydrate metabolism regulator)
MQVNVTNYLLRAMIAKAKVLHAATLQVSVVGVLPVF